MSSHHQALGRAGERLAYYVGRKLAADVRADVPPEDQPRSLRKAAELLHALWAEEIARES